MSDLVQVSLGLLPRVSRISTTTLPFPVSGRGSQYPTSTVQTVIWSGFECRSLRFLLFESPDLSDHYLDYPFGRGRPTVSEWRVTQSVYYYRVCILLR